MVLCSMTTIADLPRILVSVAEKIESWTELIAEGLEILVSQSSTITDDLEKIVEETELIVIAGFGTSIFNLTQCRSPSR